MTSKTEFVYDTKFHRRFRLEYEIGTNEILSINKSSYKNTLYFYENYGTMDHKYKDVIWISDDNYVIELNKGVFGLAKNIDFFNTLRILKTHKKITSYIDYLIL